MKEKRIFCIEVSGECQHLMNVNRPSLARLCGSSQGLYCTKNIYWKPISKDACKNCKEGRYQGFTRKQAIYKIAKAICKMDYTECSDCSDCAFKDKPKECKAFLKSSDFYEQAEVVLEDILEVHNDER